MAREKQIHPMVAAGMSGSPPKIADIMAKTGLERLRCIQPIFLIHFTRSVHSS
jgi:hypothetical protein